jgi:uncharacterized membrane protein
MAVLDSVKNTFINTLLKRMLDGNQGSNILGVLITAVVGAQINYVKALDGFKFDNADNATEAAKLVATIVVAVFAYFVGKKPALKS